MLLPPVRHFPNHLCRDPVEVPPITLRLDDAYVSGHGPVRLHFLQTRKRIADHNPLSVRECLTGRPRMSISSSRREKGMQIAETDLTALEASGGTFGL